MYVAKTKALIRFVVIFSNIQVDLNVGILQGF